ncbi:MAG: hypothetical protein LBF58_07985 [Deltaproteobacteria bacterium]|nr:hypothetical protein [Deltaproteobacteria bacterium]
MRLKSPFVSLFACLVFFAVALPLAAQGVTLAAKGVTLTAKDVDIIIQMSDLASDDKRGMEKLIAQSGRDQEALGGVMFKIIGIASMIDGNVTDVGQISEALRVPVSPAEYDLVNGRKGEVMAAVVKLIGK